MTQISHRLHIEGPDRDGDYEITIKDAGVYGEDTYHYITRAEADALIAALTPAPPVAPKENE